MERLALPHWLIVVGALLVIAGLVGLVIRRQQFAKVQDDPAKEPSPEPRPQLPPLPDLLDSRPRKNRRSMLSEEKYPPGPPPGRPRAEGEGMSELEPTPDLPDKTPAREVRFPTWIKNALFAAGLKTVGEVREVSDETLLSFQDFGKSSVSYLRETLGLPSTDGVRPSGKRPA